MGREISTAERLIARIARGQQGVVTRVQLLAAGLSSREIQRRVEKGLLIPVHRGVYRVGHRAPSVEATYMAAVLACGKGAVLCGRAAAHLHCLIKGPPPRAEVAAPTERRVKGVITHRVRDVRATKVRGIPVTTVPWTVVDLAADLPEDELARAVHEAGVRHGTKPRHIDAVLRRRPNAPGAATLRAVMHGHIPVALSKLEAAFIALLRAEGLPPPHSNERVGNHRVDIHWPDLTVEVDSFKYHNSRYSWEQDRKRERDAHARNDAFRRYTWRDVFEDPEPMLYELRRLLLSMPSSRSSSGSVDSGPR